MMKRLPLLAAALALPLAATLQVASPVAASTSSCTPKADPPFISAGRGYAHVHTTGCDSDTYTYEIRFSTAGGVILAGFTVNNAHGNIDATAPLFNTLTGCAGNQVRSFIWLNVGGVVKSNQSGLVGC